MVKISLEAKIVEMRHFPRGIYSATDKCEVNEGRWSVRGVCRLPHLWSVRSAPAILPTLRRTQPLTPPPPAGQYPGDSLLGVKCWGMLGRVCRSVVSRSVLRGGSRGTLGTHRDTPARGQRGRLERSVAAGEWRQGMLIRQFSTRRLLRAR